VSDTGFLSIGRFARLSGLSVVTLRHYDETDLLAPAYVDPATGYRYYRRDQVPRARLVRALRWLDMPIEDVRTATAPGATADTELRAHRRRLERLAALTSARLTDLDRYRSEGLPMPTIPPGAAPVQIKLAVEDVPAAVEFYNTALGLSFDVVRRTGDDDVSAFVFGRYGEAGFFLLHLIDDVDEPDRPGTSTFGLSVDDVDAYHARAVAAGGLERSAPADAEGMPRSSSFTDPSGNWVWLYQA
jgi:DNA-binding transcriptional MerR regulator/catechol 2,3-dioxygenase-like lactoylglutathione lyase family enzyme